MKVVVAVLAISFVFVLGEFTDEQKEKAMAYKESCVAESGVDSSILENIKNGEFPEGDEKLGCFAMCMMKKFGFVSEMNADGEIEEAAIRAKIPPHVPQEDVDNIFAKCSGISGTGCEKGSNLLKCVMENKKFPVLD